MLQAVVNAFKIADLRRKILFTLGMLVVFRFVAHVPVPGVDFTQLNRALQDQTFGGLFNVLNIFSGGTLQNFSVAAMGVYPYITASIIIQLLTGVIPRLTELSKEGEAGRNQINKYIHYLTVPLAALQAFGQAQLLHSQFGALPKFGFFGAGSDWIATLTVIVSLVCGTMFLVWLGELITENGIGQGISIIIFGGIVSRLPSQVTQLFQGGSGQGIFSILVFLAVGLATIIGIVLVNEGQRRIPVHYSRSIMRGGRMMRQAGSSFIPLRVNSAGMIPLILALSLMAFPGIVAGFFIAAETQWVKDLALFIYGVFQPTSPFYNILYFTMVVAFTFFYTSVQFSQQRIAENLQKQGGAVPGIRPGPNTDRFLNTVVTRITVVGALFLGVVAIAPWLASLLTNATAQVFTSTALLIVVGVAIDTMKQLEAQLLMRRYEGFINR